MSGMGNLDKFFLGRRPTWTPHRHGGESFNNMSHFSSPPKTRYENLAAATPSQNIQVQSKTSNCQPYALGWRERESNVPSPFYVFFSRHLLVRRGGYIRMSLSGGGGSYFPYFTRRNEDEKKERERETTTPSRTEEDPPCKGKTRAAHVVSRKGKKIRERQREEEAMA